MRIFGQIAELTKVLWRKNGKTVELTPAEPTVSTVLTIPDPGDAADEVVLKDTAQTLTTKTIDADNNTISNLETDNLKSGVLNTDTGLAGAADTQLPSALAVKTYVDDSVSGVNEASEISYNNATSGLTATDVQAAIDEVEGRLDTAESGVSTNATNLSDHETETTGAHASSAISYDNTASGLSATTVKAAIDEVEGRLDTEESKTQPVNQGGTGFTSYATGDLLVASGVSTLSKLGIGAPGRFLLSDGSTASWSSTFSSGAISAENFTFADTKGVQSQTATSTLNVGTLTNTTTLNLGNTSATTNVNGLATFDSVSYASVDVVAAGPALAVTAAYTTFRLQSGFGATLSSVTGAAADRQIVVVNETGSSLTVSNGSIITGTGADLVIEDDAALTLIYDGTNWNVVGGAGAGGGLATEFVAADPAPAANNTHYLVDCSGGPVTITLPDAPQPGAVIRVSDESGDSGTNNITVAAGAGDTIDGDTSFIIDVDNGWAQFMWTGTDWHVDTLAVNATSGILSLGGQSGAAYPTQTFSSTDSSITINSSAGDHDIELADTIAGARTFTGQIAIQNGGKTLRLGADLSASTLTNATRKYAYLAVPQYTNAEEDVLLAQVETDTAFNVVRYGGGDGSYNALTEHRWYTAANATTTTGTERMRLDSSGNVGIGTSSPDVLLHGEGEAYFSGDHLTDAAGAALSVGYKGGLYANRIMELYTYGPTYAGGSVFSMGANSALLRTVNNAKLGIQSAEEIYFGTNNSATASGEISLTGAWTLGPSSATSGTLKHNVYGAVEITHDNTASGNNGTLEVYRPNSAVESDIVRLKSDVGGTDVLKWRVECDGDTVSSSGSYTSDLRAKKNVAPIHYGLAEILQLDPMSFNWKHEEDNEVKSFSLGSAQKVQELMPEMVRDDGLEDGEGGHFKAVYEKEVIAVMVRAIQELAALRSGDADRIAELQSEIETLKGGA